MVYPHLLGNWSELVDRLDAAGCPRRWSADPRLAALSTVQQLQDWTGPGNPRRADGVLGALVRFAAAAGANDPDANVVLLHLLCPAADRLAYKLRNLSPDPLSLVLGELAIQIRRFPVGRRTRAHAANLLLDTQMALRRGELKPYRGLPAELLVDPIDDARPPDGEFGRHGLLEKTQPGTDSDDLDLVDMLLWARRSGAVDAEDLAVLVEVEYARERPGGSAQQRVADAHGWTVRTVQRRRDRALAALRACSAEYLAAA